METGEGLAGCSKVAASRCNSQTKANDVIRFYDGRDCMRLLIAGLGVLSLLAASAAVAQDAKQGVSQKGVQQKGGMVQQKGGEVKQTGRPSMAPAVQQKGGEVKQGGRPSAAPAVAQKGGEVKQGKTAPQSPAQKGVTQK